MRLRERTTPKLNQQRKILNTANQAIKETLRKLFLVYCRIVATPRPNEAEVVASAKSAEAEDNSWRDHDEELRRRQKLVGPAVFVDNTRNVSYEAAEGSAEAKSAQA